MIVSDWKDRLNNQQRKAVTHWGSPLLVLAGAGSGKTRVLTYRAFWLIEEKKIPAEKIILMTFTNKAAEEMGLRIKKLLGESGRDVRLGFAGTFHGFCALMLRRYGREIGIEPNFVIYDPKDQESVVKSSREKLGLPYERGKHRGILAYISKMKNDLKSPGDVEGWAKDGFQKELIRIWKVYERTLRENNALDFDDLLIRGVTLLNKKNVRDRVNEQYGWVLVDEYQDTNKAQFELTKMLSPESDRLTAVGDVSQAIYSFRGADYRNLELLKESFPDLTVIELSKNYRSTQRILDAAYGIIANNKEHPVIKLETDGDKGGLLKVTEVGDERVEAKKVIDWCEEKVKKEKTVAILYRTNAQSRSFEEELIKRGLRYKLVGGVRFYDRAEIKDLVAYLRVVANPKDKLSWERIEKIGKRRRASFEEWVEKKGKGVDKMEPVEVLEGVLEVTKYLEKFNEKDEKDRGRLENINELMAVAGEHRDLGEFLEKITLVQADEQADRKYGDEFKVSLMTVHSAKGLEFDWVAIGGMEEGLFPHSRSLMEKKDLEEERRLMYVAVTRAKEGVSLSWVKSRLVYGGRSNQMPSRFLMEIPETLKKQEWVREELGEVRRKTEVKGRTNKYGDSEDKFFVKRKVVQDWEVEKETKSDFDDIDSW